MSSTVLLGNRCACVCVCVCPLHVYTHTHIWLHTLTGLKLHENLCHYLAELRTQRIDRNRLHTLLYLFSSIYFVLLQQWGVCFCSCSQCSFAGLPYWYVCMFVCVYTVGNFILYWRSCGFQVNCFNCFFAFFAEKYFATVFASCTHAPMHPLTQSPAHSLTPAPRERRAPHTPSLVVFLRSQSMASPPSANFSAFLPSSRWFLNLWHFTVIMFCIYWKCSVTSDCSSSGERGDDNVESGDRRWRCGFK